QHARLDNFAEIKAQHNIIDTHNYQTDDPAIFAAGDIVKGDKTLKSVISITYRYSVAI
ncbi:hypothetical protein ONO57_25300, partial [Salmonella enterica subsp. enterica serovar Anatum]|nr:hypothetical protein [Salmonella enterica subsp. enterica serovar Anatum]